MDCLEPETSQNWSEGNWILVSYTYSSFKFMSECRQRPAYTCLCTVHSLWFTTYQHCTRCFWWAHSDPLQVTGSFCFLQTTVRDASTCEKLSLHHSSQSPYIEHQSHTQTDRTTASLMTNEIDRHSHSCPHTPSTLSAHMNLLKVCANVTRSVRLIENYGGIQGSFISTYGTFFCTLKTLSVFEIKY